MTTFTRPAYRIVADDRTDFVGIQSYSLDGNPHTNVAHKEIPASELPQLLMQLVFAGYFVNQPRIEEGGIHIIEARSGEFLSRMAKAKGWEV